jgi:L-threonylcarbamoyladenylate synthase
VIDLDGAVAALRRGGLVAFPTETVYGLGADATNVTALHRLYAVKGRPPEHPVIVHLAVDTPRADWVVDLPGWAHELATACWPGPLTLIGQRTDRVPDEVTGGLETVGVRVPDHPVAQRLLAVFGGGVAAPSANRFGRVSPTSADDVRDDLGDDVDVVLDGGPSAVGVESTIVDCTGEDPVVLRPGAVTAEQIAAVTGRAVGEHAVGSSTPAPGSLPSHYAPSARVELVDEGALALRAAALLTVGHRIGVLGTDGVDVPESVERLAAPADPEAYAHDLYARLREADAHGLDVLLVVPPADTGIGVAVRDRLRRAAGVSEGAEGT